MKAMQVPVAESASTPLDRVYAIALLEFPTDIQFSDDKDIDTRCDGRWSVNAPAK